jgi:hypothetical protein
LVFTDWTDRLPAVTPDDHLEASALRFEDIDGDGIGDLVLLTDAPRGPGRPGLRILRGTRDDADDLTFSPRFVGQLASLTATGEPLSGDALTLGDLAGDGLPSIIISNAAPTGAASETRVLRMRTR